MPIKKPIKKAPVKAQTVKPAAQNAKPLSKWLFFWPAGFAVLALALAIISSVVIGQAAKFGSESLTGAVAFLAFLASAAFLVKKSIRLAGPGAVDRRGFLSVNAGLSLVALCYYAFFLVIGMVLSMESVMMFQYRLFAYSAPLYYVSLIPLALAALYILGVAVFAIIAAYKYAAGMGAPKWKLMLSIPFGTLFLGYPAYLMESENKAAAVSSKRKWFNAFVGWIMRAPLNGVAGLLLAAVAFSFFINLSLSLVLAASLVAFLVLFKACGRKKPASIFAGILSSVAIAVNIVYILVLLYSAFGKQQPQQPVLTVDGAVIERIEIVE